MPLPLVHIPLFNANLMSSCSFQVLINSKMPRFTKLLEKQILSVKNVEREGREGREWGERDLELLTTSNR